MFIQPDVHFARKSQFRDSFCIDNVREGLIVCFIHHLTATARSYCSAASMDNKIPPTLLLLLSKFCLDFGNGNVHYLVIFNANCLKNCHFVANFPFLAVANRRTVPHKSQSKFGLDFGERNLQHNPGVGAGITELLRANSGVKRVANVAKKCGNEGLVAHYRTENRKGGNEAGC